MTSNFQLEKYIKQHPLNNQVFLGVFSEDTLPNTNVKNACMIINYSPDDKAGSHWVAMSGLNGKLPLYFDSYGLKPDGADTILGWNTDFDEYLNRHSLRSPLGGNSTTGNYDYNKVDLQSWKHGEDECGEWCLWFLKHGLPSATNPCWAPYLSEKDAVARDRMIRRRIGIIR